MGSFSGREARLRTDEFKSAMDYVTSIGHVNDMKDGILRWCEKSGISIDLINNFRKAMSTGVPEDLTYNNSDTNANIITKATTSDLKTIFNGTGYEDGKYCSTNDINTYSPDSNFFATGIMHFATPISLANKTGGGTIYIKGAEFTTSLERNYNLQCWTNVNSFGNKKIFYSNKDFGQIL